MPVRNCCLGCQGPMSGPCGPLGHRLESSGNCVGPCCVHAAGIRCSPACGECGIMHGQRGVGGGSFFSCGHGCIGGCIGGVCGSCCGPACR